MRAAVVLLAPGAVEEALRPQGDQRRAVEEIDLAFFDADAAVWFCFSVGATYVAHHGDDLAVGYQYETKLPG